MTTAAGLATDGGPTVMFGRLGLPLTAAFLVERTARRRSTRDRGRLSRSCWTYRRMITCPIISSQ